MAANAHPGFQALVAQGVPAGALANAARNASPAAKRANPRLKRVLPAKKGAAKKVVRRKRKASPMARKQALALIATSAAAKSGPMMRG